MVSGIHARIARNVELRGAEDKTVGVPPASGTASQSEATSTPAPQRSPVQNFSTSTIGLSAVIAVFALVIFTYAGYKLKTRRQKKRSVASKRGVIHSLTLNNSSFGDEKYAIDLERPHRAVLTPPARPAADSGVGWSPQIRSVNGTVTTPSPTKKSLWSKATKSQTSPTTPPPPIYTQLPFTKTERLLTPPTAIATGLPGLTFSPPSDRAEFSNLHPAHQNEQYITIAGTKHYPDSPLPSPARSVSFAHTQFDHSELTTPAGKGTKKYPRLMTVVNFFVPTLPDELPVKIGETVRMLEEYEDEWCLVQHLGHVDAVKGVIPRFCLTERTAVIPQLNSLDTYNSMTRI